MVQESKHWMFLNVWWRIILAEGQLIWLWDGKRGKWMIFYVILNEKEKLFKIVTRNNVCQCINWLLFSSTILSPKNFILWSTMHDAHVPNAPFLFCSLAVLWALRRKNTPLCFPPPSWLRLLEQVPTTVTKYGCGIMANLQQRHLMTCCAWCKLL